MTLYRVRDLAVAIAGRPMVAGIDFAVERGRAVAIVGPSGLGKTQTCFAPFGLAAGVASGSARLEGVELVGLDPRALNRLRGRDVGFVWQQPASALSPHRSVGRALREAWTQADAPPPTASELADLLAKVELGPELLPRYPHQLSGGQRQRVAIAMAIAHRPALIVADEPTAALDPPLRRGVADLLRRLVDERGAGLLVVSHDAAAVARLADEVLDLQHLSRSAGEGGAHAAQAAWEGEGQRCEVADQPRAGLHPRTSRPLPHAGEGALLAASDVSIRYGRGPLTVADATLSIAPGECAALVGASGSGKSTLARALAGLQPIAAGRLVWDGRPLPKHHPYRGCDRALVQPVFQDPAGSLDPGWTVADTVAEPLVHLAPKLARAGRAARVHALLAEVGLDPALADRRARTLSGGQAQRVAIARALAAGPRLLVLDEATSALDAAAAGHIASLLERLAAERGLALLCVTHDLALARRLCARIAVMEGGRIVEAGRTEAVLAAPAHPATRRLTAAG